MTVKVDVEKLTHGLEDGIGRIWEHSDIGSASFIHVPIEQRLRLAPCGLVSTAVDLYARSEGLNSRLLISSPKLSYLPEEHHVMAAIEDDPNNPTVIDATASQLLDYAGLSTAYEMITKQEFFPAEKIITFDLYSPVVAVDWLVSAVERFRNIRQQLPTGFAKADGAYYSIGGPLFGASSEELRQAYAAFYNPSNLQTWTPPKHVIDDAEAVAEAISPGAIEID